LEQQARPLSLPRGLLCGSDFYWPERKQGVFYLTIDDGPCPEILEDLLVMLSDHEANATFFWLGEKLSQTDEQRAVARLYHLGHRLGLHGYTHRNPWRLSRDTWVADVERGWRLVEAVMPEPVRYYRPAYGHYRPLLRRWPFRCVLWDLMPPDYRHMRGWAVPLAERVRTGDVVVLHERGGLCLAEWRLFLGRARDKGLKAQPLP